MDMLDHATGLVFHESNFSQIQAQYNHQHKLVQVFHYGRNPEDCNSALEALRHHAKLNATHDSGKRSESSRCYPGTRLAVFEGIDRWIQGQDPGKRTCCLWLSGAAGGGKSTIAQTLAERCRDQDVPVLSYFLSHTPSGSEQIQSVIHTIAYQLCSPPSTLSQYILQAIHGDPAIFSKGPKLQIEQLIVRPFREACQANPFFKFTTRVVIIDGLDSCGTAKEQQLLFSLFMDAITQNDLPLHLLVTSRPEPHIPIILARYPSCVRHIVLDATTADIAHYVRSSLHELVNSRYHVTERLWPAKEDIAIIVERSSGQFLYASDVLTYVSSTPHGAEGRFQEVLRPQEGHCILPKVDAVFKQLLESVEPRHLDNILDTFAWMGLYGGYIAVGDRVNLPETPDYAPFSIPWLARMLAQPPSKVPESFITLHSLLDIPEHPDSQQPLHLYHASLFEFLADEARAGKTFFMDEAAAHGRIVGCMVRCLRSRTVGSVSASGTETLDESRWVDRVFRCHLVQARPSQALVESLEGLMGLRKPSSSTQYGSSNSGSANRMGDMMFNTFMCDTRRLVLCFLKNYYESHYQESVFRMTNIRKRLAMFWFFKIFATKRCGKDHCSCAVGRITGPHSP